MQKDQELEKDLEQIAKEYPDIAEELLDLSNALNAKNKQEEAQKNFIPYVKHMWSDVIIGKHHKRFAEKLEGVARGDIKRLIVNMPPRHTKSEFASVFFPSWLLGHQSKTQTHADYAHRRVSVSIR